MTETIFYDGHCGLCHASVKFVLRHDPDGDLFRFAPLQGPTFETSVSPGERAAMPDSMAVRTLDGRLLLRSDAWVHIFRRLGGAWKLLGGLFAIVPRPLRDWFYDRVAATRSRLFERQNQLCPIIPPDLRHRFDP